MTLIYVLALHICTTNYAGFGTRPDDYTKTCAWQTAGELHATEGGCKEAGVARLKDQFTGTDRAGEVREADAYHCDTQTVLK